MDGRMTNNVLDTSPIPCLRLTNDYFLFPYLFIFSSVIFA